MKFWNLIGVAPDELCRSCQHGYSAHISHLVNKNDSDLDQLLDIVVDIENLFGCVQSEEDADTKQIYYFLFRLLKNSVLQLQYPPSIDSPLGSPPFESPSIGRALSNFAVMKVCEIQKFCSNSGSSNYLFHFSMGQ